MATLPNSNKEYSAPFDSNFYDTWGSFLNAILVWFDAEFVSKTLDQIWNDKTLSGAVFKDESEEAYSLGSISGAVTVDYRNGHVQYATVTGNITSLTISNWPPTGKNGYLTLELQQDGTGGRTIALSSAYKTPDSGAGITLSTASGARDKLYLETRTAGTLIDASIRKDFK